MGMMKELDSIIQRYQNSDTSLESENNELETKTFKIKGNPKQLKTIEAILSYIQWLGWKGHSSSFIVAVDGDGGARFRITNENGKDILKTNHNKEYINSLIDENGDIKQFVLE